MNVTAGSTRQGRLDEPPFFVWRTAARALVAAALVTLAGWLPSPPALGASADWIVLGDAGAATLRTLDCASGRELARIELPAELTAKPAWASGGDAVFATTGGALLLRYSLPELHERARTTLRFDATALAVSGGLDGVVLAGGGGAPMLSAHDPTSLGTLHEYRHDEDAAVATVATIVDLPSRARFALAFSDLPEAWEIAYDRDAPPVLQGLVHDYRMREAVELPGRLTPRRFRLPNETRGFVAGAEAFELLRIDAADRIGVVQLNVRREIERPDIGRVPPARGIAAWRSASQRGWVFADDGGAELRVLRAGDWRLAPPVPLPGPLVALAPDEGGVLVAHRSAAGTDVDARVVVATLDVASREWKTVSELPRAATAPLRFVRGTRDCVALVDRDGNWQAGFTRETRAAARRRGS